MIAAKPQLPDSKMLESMKTMNISQLVEYLLRYKKFLQIQPQDIYAQAEKITQAEATQLRRFYATVIVWSQDFLQRKDLDYYRNVIMYANDIILSKFILNYFQPAMDLIIKKRFQMTISEFLETFELQDVLSKMFDYKTGKVR